MLKTIKQLSELLKSAGYTVYQDIAIGTRYPYCVYNFVSDSARRASNKAVTHVREYQLSLYSTEDATCLDKLTGLLDGAGVVYEPFVGVAGNENDDTVTNYYTYVHIDVGGGAYGE